MNETTKLVVGGGITGMLASAIPSLQFTRSCSFTVLVKLYVAMLLILMGVCSLYTARPGKSTGPAGCGLLLLGGSTRASEEAVYGPVITVGGVIAECL